MSTLEEMIRSGSPATPIQFRAKPYGNEEVQEFLRDLLAMANANVKGPRLIVVGVDAMATGADRVPGVDESDFTRQPTYMALAHQYITPAIAFNYLPANHDNTHVGIFQIAACPTRPYTMAEDYSPELRRGQAWIRINNERFELDADKLNALATTKTAGGIAPDQVEVGFAGESTYQQMTFPVCDLNQLPSVLAAGKVRQLLMTQQQASGTGMTTMMVRLTHARIYQGGDEYQPQTPEAMKQQMANIALRHRADDRRFMFETNGGEVQLRVFNQSTTALENPTLTLTVPNLPGLYVARNPADENYPTVEINNEAAVATANLSTIAPGTACQAFKTGVRLCAGQSLDGQRIALGYTLAARNLSSPINGQLAVDFKDQLQALMA